MVNRVHVGRMCQGMYTDGTIPTVGRCPYPLYPCRPGERTSAARSRRRPPRARRSTKCRAPKLSQALTPSARCGWCRSPALPSRLSSSHPSRLRLAVAALPLPPRGGQELSSELGARLQPLPVKPVSCRARRCYGGRQSYPSTPWR
jgi:hypothetical protein